MHTFAPLNQAVQPAGAYELLFSLGLFVVLWPLRFRLHPAGLLFVLYLSLYCVGQFVLFIWRDNPISALNLKQAQITAVAVLALTVICSCVIVGRPEWFDPDYADDPDGEEDLPEGDEGQLIEAGPSEQASATPIGTSGV